MVCQICGAKSGYYPLCKNCFKLRDEGKVTKCEECGIWKNDAKPLCRECWLKNNRSEQKLSIDYKISNGEAEEEDFRSKFPAKYRTDDGHLVRSKAEKIIDNWLYHNDIVHAYERRVPIKEELICDFYIPKRKIWIEYWGFEDQKYIKRKELKIELYKKNEKNLIELTDTDIKKLDDFLPLKLRPYLPSDFSFD
ncbi:MAG: hypothetical protein ACFFA2_14105 [Promethearchaeota archaeon]